MAEKFDYNEINKIASKVAMREGHKSNVSIGDIREILGILADLIYEDDGFTLKLYEYGLHRAAK